MAVLILFHKNSSSQNSEWNSEIVKNGVDSALSKFCRQMPMSPSKVLRTAFNIRGLSSAYISRVFIRTEMVLKSRSVLNTGPRQLARSRSSENLPTSQSQVNIQMMSHTLTIREVFITFAFLSIIIFFIYIYYTILYYLSTYNIFYILYYTLLYCVIYTYGVLIYFFHTWWRCFVYFFQFG